MDAVDAPGAQLDEIIGTAAVPYGSYGIYSRDVTIRRTRCTTLPCVIDAPRGVNLFEVAGESGSERFHVNVEDQARTSVRVRLPQTSTSTLGVVGWTLAGLSTAAAITGATMWGADSSMLGVAGATVLVSSAVVAIVGFAIGLTHLGTSRPGGMTWWVERVPKMDSR